MRASTHYDEHGWEEGHRRPDNPGTALAIAGTRLPFSSLPKMALQWSPSEGKGGTGRPRETWRRTVEKDLDSRGLTFGTVPRAAAEGEPHDDP